MRRAREKARGNADVFLLTTQYPEDTAILPPHFQPTLNLERSILDFGEFQKPRKLPLLRDILTRAYEHSNAEYLIYTNVDIGLQPHFYTRVAEFISRGYDAFTINRRTISDHYDNLDQIPEMYADLGEPHRGWDCFIFRRGDVQRYNLEDVCIGIPRADLVLLANMQAYAENFCEFRQEQLTFHIGNDRSWWKNTYSDYTAHNTQAAIRILSGLEQEVGLFPHDSPPATFLYFARNKLCWFIYENLLRYLHIPARFGRPLRTVMRIIRSRRSV